MKLRAQDQEFRNPKVFYPDPKNIDLDRVLINLFLLLRCGGTRPVTKGRQRSEFATVRQHLDNLNKLSGVQGFAAHPEVAKAWLEADIFDLVNRGRPTEAIASLRPLHLDAHKIRVAKHCRDYNHADALYAMLDRGEQSTIRDLRRYLERGRDAATKRYDGKTQLDLETLTVLKLVEELDDMHISPEKVTPSPPTCIGQARVLCDDVQRILVYQDVVPRPVMIDYLKTILGLHLGIYTFRVARQLWGWISDRKANPTCQECPVQGTHADPFAGCPYQLSFTVDMGDDYRSRMAALAQDDAAAKHKSLVDLVRAVFSMNQLLRYAKEEKLDDDPFAVPELLANPTPEFEADFKSTLKTIRRLNGGDGEGVAEEAVPPEIQSIFDAGLPPFDTLIELVTHVRQKHHLSYLVQMIDKLFQKNQPFGALLQGRSKGNPRRWHLEGRLLEVFVQLAVLRFEEVPGGKRFYTKPVLIDDFLLWVERRYGFVVAAGTTPTAPRPRTLEEHRAFRENVRALKERLREIGFFDDLSDAYNAQMVRPRYHIDVGGGE